jgi:hypothetical protein
MLKDKYKGNGFEGKRFFQIIVLDFFKKSVQEIIWL